jgi:cytochrome bd-type quinol oxidase subunit 1
MVLAGIAAIGLYITKTKEILLKKFNVYALIVAVLLCILAFETGSTGGDIRHSEIKQGLYKK